MRTRYEISGAVCSWNDEMNELEAELSTTKNELEDVTRSLASTREQLAQAHSDIRDLKTSLAGDKIRNYEQQLSVARDYLVKISKQYGEGYNITYPTASTMTADEALKKLQEMEGK